MFELERTLEFHEVSGLEEASWARAVLALEKMSRAHEVSETQWQKVLDKESWGIPQRNS